MVDPEHKKQMDNFLKTGKFFSQSKLSPQDIRGTASEQSSKAGNEEIKPDTTTQLSGKEAREQRQKKREQLEALKAAAFKAELKEARAKAGLTDEVPHRYETKKPTSADYARASISDMEQKMAQLSSMSLGNIGSGGGKTEQTTNSTTSNLNSYTTNVSQTTSDHLRNLRSDYEKIPQWRTDMG